MGGWGGLIELVLVFGLVFGWGIVQLRATKRDGEKAKARQDEADR